MVWRAWLYWQGMDEVILIFDGACLLCNRVVRFIARHDRNRIFRFMSGHSEEGIRQLAGSSPLVQDAETIILLEGNCRYVKSAAALRAARYLGKPCSLLYAFILIPAPIRDFFYDIIAKNRYRWFGCSTICTISDQGPRRDSHDRIHSG